MANPKRKPKPAAKDDARSQAPSRAAQDRIAPVLVRERKGGARTALATPGALPTDLVPGELLGYPRPNGGIDWYLLIDKLRWWNGSSWQSSATIQRAKASELTDDELPKFRRKWLKKTGWL